MMPHRKRFAVVIGVMTFAVCVPVAGASASLANGPCATGDSAGTVGGTNNSVCQGSGLSFIAPSVGEVSTVIGPTVIGPATIGNAISSGGSVVTAP
ncbi:MAG: hypothetical protein QOJ23_3501 [Actinomycetota bacterium]|jgi:hypothetical protein|nr:hypothetical protein [Actinomycetota bacterium]MDQ1498073.1 hypothetical protein [Actinomycetota bacterium]MDQ1567112.1 hypothetical protein [Actinomycetota bacterium]